MKCDKCNMDFPENEIQDSHDVPKYMGGQDKDGRHWLCKLCHDDYENKVLRQATMTLIKNSLETIKSKCRWQARIVKGYFFKKDGNTKTIKKE